MYVFSLQDTDLKNLASDRAVDFVRRLLWAEASRVGVGKNLVDVPQCINVGDGGLDALIESASPASEEIISRGTTGYQVKASDLQPGKCKKELHQKKDLTKPIKPEIKRLLDNSGTYVLVLFADLTGQKKRKREDAIKEELQKFGYSEPKIRVYSMTQLVSFAERFPSLVAWLKNDRSQCLCYEVWSRNRDVSIPKIFVENEDRQKKIEEIREKLRNPEEQCQVFRATALSGLGKTRLVFETLSPEDLKHRVIYVKADEFKGKELHNTLQSDTDLLAIIVVDECDLQQHEDFVRSFSNRGPRLGLVTISQEVGNVPPPTLSYKLDPLARDDIKEILKNEAPPLPQNVADRIAYFADGYPKIATLLAENYLASPGSSPTDLLTINDDALINRLIAGRMDETSEHFKKTKRVLMGLALFEKVGYKAPLSSEAQWVSRLRDVNWNDFQEIVREQKQRGTIQGEYYIYVTPFPLAVHLVREWWETYGDRLDFEQFVESIPQKFRADLLPRLFSRFPFITTTEQGQKLVKHLLGNDGVFGDGSLLQKQPGGEFFLKLTEADPKSALDCLKRTIGTWSKENLLEFKAGRREAVWALEKIAIWKDLFADAARLLLALGEAENESCSNNASGVFVDLFSLAPGEVAPTEALPEERFPILIEAINSESLERKKLALRAFKSALQSGDFTRSVGAEYQGGRQLPKLWMPKTYGELFDAYRRVWNYLDNNLENFDEETREEAVEILLDSARGISLMQNLSEMVRTTIKRLAKYSWCNKEKILQVVIDIVHFDGKQMLPEILKDWVGIRDDLTGTSYAELLRRFVGMDLLEDGFDEEGNRTNEVDLRIQELALQAVEKPGLLVSEYSWLTTEQAKKGYAFGYELGQADSGFSFLDTLLTEQAKTISERGACLLGGYLRALFKKDLKLWEETLDSAVKNKRLQKLVPELTWRSGMTDRAALRILELAKNSDMEIEHFRMFGLGTVIKDLSESVFVQWVEYLLEESSGLGATICLGLFHFYYFRGQKGKTIPKDLGLKLLCHSAFFENPHDIQRNQTSEYDWKEMALALLSQSPEAGEVLADKLLEYFGEEKSIIGGFRSDTQIVLNETAKRNPKQIWGKIAGYLGPPIDRRAFHLKEWLRGIKGWGIGRSGSLSLFDLDDIWKWVEKDVEKRVPYLATFLPPSLFHSVDRVCVARELLVRYGQREDVRQNLAANFFMESWCGSLSVHYEQKKLQLHNYRKDETNLNVINWIDKYIKSLEHNIERARIEEERRGF